jgi:hypothetical protein
MSPPGYASDYSCETRTAGRAMHENQKVIRINAWISAASQSAVTRKRFHLYIGPQNRMLIRKSTHQFKTRGT